MCFSGPDRQNWLPLLATVLVCLTLVACGGMVRLPSDAPTAWYAQDSGLYAYSREAVFHGVGVAGGSGPATLRRVSADNRARSELARVLDRYLTELVRTSPSTSALPQAERDRIVGRLLRQAVAAALVSDHWIDGGSGQYHALCDLRLATLKALIGDDAGLNPEVRAGLIAAADNVFFRLSRQFQS